MALIKVSPAILMVVCVVLVLLGTADASGDPKVCVKLGGSCWPRHINKCCKGFVCKLEGRTPRLFSLVFKYPASSPEGQQGHLRGWLS